MKILELFCGTKSFSKEAEGRGHKCFTVDINKKFSPDLCKDIMNIKLEEIPFVPDVIWASPPCTEYSHAKRIGIRDIKGANKMVKKTLEIIRCFKPKVWIIENPQTGLLKKQIFMKNIPFVDVSYCKYGMPYRKQTRLWTNLKFYGLVCNKNCNFMNGKKHIGSAGNGRKMYTNKHYKLTEKYVIPQNLCLELIRLCEKEVKK